MAVKKIEKGKVIKKNVNGTIFDVRQVPRYTGHGKDKKMESSSMCLFIGKKKLKSGFKNVEEAGKFAVKNLQLYNKTDKVFN